MNRVEKIKKKLKKSIDEMPVERLAVFLTVSGDVDFRMAQIGLEAFKEFESEIIKAKGNAGIDDIDYRCFKPKENYTRSELLA